MSKPTYGLNLDERETLALFEDTSAWPALKKLLETLVVDVEQAVLKYRLEDGPERLVHAKARAEGARKIATELKFALEDLANREMQASRKKD